MSTEIWSAFGERLSQAIVVAGMPVTIQYALPLGDNNRGVPVTTTYNSLYGFSSPWTPPTVTLALEDARSAKRLLALLRALLDHLADTELMVRDEEGEWIDLIQAGRDLLAELDGPQFSSGSTLDMVK